MRWLSQPQLQQTTSVGTATAPQPMQQGGSSSSESMEESSADLVLPASGILPIPQHLKTITQGKFVDLPDLLLEALRAFELAGYTSIVSNLAREGSGQAWVRYDQLFRQAAATNPELQWHKREPDIWLMAVIDAIGSPSTHPAAQQGQPPADQDKICCCRNGD